MLTHRPNNIGDTRIDESLVRAEDYWFNFELYKKCEAIGGVDIIGYNYYQDNQNSIMHKWRDEFFEQSNRSRKRLLSEKPEDIEINMQDFASGYLYEVAVYMRDMLKQKRKDKVMAVLNNDFYLSQAKYTEKLPKHIRLITQNAAKKKYKTVMLLLRLWSVIGK